MKSVTIHQKNVLGDWEVNILACREPCLLLEAAELVYALVNDIPPENMTLPGEYYLPAVSYTHLRAHET